MFDYSDDEDEFSTPGVVSQGQEYPVRHDDLVQANAGYGAAPAAQRQYNPAAYPLAPRPLEGSPDGIGAYSRLYQMPTPSATKSGVLGSILSGSPIVRGMRAVSGLGDAATPPGGAAAPVAVSSFLVAAVALGLVATGVGSYYVGKAVAPSRDKESKYAWWGVAAGLGLGPLGLGIEALVALNHKGR